MRPAPRCGPAPLFSAVLSSLLLLGVLMSAGPGEALAALPLVALLVALVFRLYPGERLIARLGDRFHRRRPRASSTPAPAHADAQARRPALVALAVIRPLRGPPLSFRHPIQGV